MPHKGKHTKGSTPTAFRGEEVGWWATVKGICSHLWCVNCHHSGYQKVALAQSLLACRVIPHFEVWRTLVSLESLAVVVCDCTESSFRVPTSNMLDDWGCSRMRMPMHALWSNLTGYLLSVPTCAHDFLNCICPSCKSIIVTRNDAVLNPGINQQETLSQRVHKMLSRLMRSSSGLTWKDQWVELWPWWMVSKEHYITISPF